MDEPPNPCISTLKNWDYHSTILKNFINVTCSLQFLEPKKGMELVEPRDAIIISQKGQVMSEHTNCYGIS